MNYLLGRWEWWFKYELYYHFTAQKLLDSFTPKENSTDVEDSVTKPLYQTLLRSYIGDSLLPSDTTICLPSALDTNADVLAAEAERLYYNCCYKDCFELTEL